MLEGDRGCSFHCDEICGFFAEGRRRRRNRKSVVLIMGKSQDNA